MKVNYAVLVYYVFLSRAKSQYPSPCPDILRYVNRDEISGRWFASLSMVSSEDLKGVWVRVELDRAAEELTSKFGGTTALNPREYLIANEDFQLQRQKVLTVNISAKYDAWDIIPSVVGIRLNGRPICGNSSTTTVTSSKTSDQTRCGATSNAWSWPWTVIILALNHGISVGDYGGGVLISDWHVLTTRTCVELSGPYLWEPQDLIIYLGTDRLKDHGPGYQIAQVGKIYQHPDPFVNDIAVIKLARAVVRTPYVMPVCIPGNNIIGKAVTQLRFTDEAGPQLVKELKMSVVQSEICLNVDRDFYSENVSPSSPKTFCGRYTNPNGSLSSTGKCGGATGCGLVSQSPDGLQWQLHGIESVAPEKCGPTGYIVFVNVTHYVDWLKSVTGLL